MKTLQVADRRRIGALGVTWILTRLISVLGIMVFTRLLDDVDLYRRWLAILDQGRFPAFDHKWQYPPGVGPLLLTPDSLHIDYSVAFVAMCLLFDLGIMVALYVAYSRRTHPSTYGLWLWAFAGLFVGPIMLTRFDIVPTFFAVLCILLVARPAWVGMSAGVGFLVKLWPALMLLVLPRRRTWKGVLWFVIAVAVLLLMIAVPLSGELSFLSNQKARGLQIESTGALPYWIAALLGDTIQTRLQYGSMQITMDGAELIGTIVSVAGVALLALIGWWRLNGRLDHVTAGDVAVPLVLVMVASSRVYSPQFNIWIIGVCAAALLSSQTRMRPVAVVLIVVSVLTQFVYPMFPWNFAAGEAWIVAIQILRIVGLLVATTLAIRQISFLRASDHSDPPAQPTLQPDAVPAGLGARNAHSATADAAATFSESTPDDMGIRTSASAS